jgi:hypothetical protein
MCQSTILSPALFGTVACSVWDARSSNYRFVVPTSAQLKKLTTIVELLPVLVVTIKCRCLKKNR